MNAPLDRLRQLVETGDPNGTVTLRWLGQIIEQPDEGKTEQPKRDLTVEEVAEMVGRAPSTVRGWLSSGALRGFKINGRDWRVAPSALEDWRAGQMRRDEPESGEDIDLGAWRKAS